jgi:hypothetical protein
MNLLGRLRGKGGPPEDRTEAILAKHLDGDFIVFPMAEARCTPSDVEAVAKRVGVRFPLEFVAHVCGTFPGIYIEAKEKVWPRPKPHEVGPFWSFLYAIHSYTPASQSDDWMRLESAAEALRSRTSVPAAPILRILGDADLYCVDARGDICQWSHETNDLTPVNLDFWSLFEREVADLRDRKTRKAAVPA